MHEQVAKSVRIGWRKYLYECTPFGYVNLCFGLGLIGYDKMKGLFLSQV